jgi:signal transduction histidine kinase
VTERVRADEALRKAHAELEQKVRDRTADLEVVNRTLRMISACNEAVIRATDELALARELCLIVHELGGYRMVWIGLAEHDARKTVRPVAAVGFEDGYLERARITWADGARGRGPTGCCIRTGEPRVCHDFMVDPTLSPWRKEAAKRGYQSSVALPLRSGGQVLGALTIYAGEAGAFDAGQVGLLTELADDIAVGILALRAQTERDHARQEAERRAVQLRALTIELGDVEQRERQRLAKVLHDHLQQLLVGAKFGLASVEGSRTARTRQQVVRSVNGALDKAIRTSRELTAELSPPALHEEGLAAGISWLGRRMAKAHGVKIVVKGDANVEPTANQVRFLLFDAVRELLFNAVKHSGVDHVQVEVRRTGDNQIQVSVADDGVGFDPARPGAAESRGFGLFSIRERLRCLGGSMEVRSKPGRGSRFTLTSPARIEESAVTDAPAPLADVVAAIRRYPPSGNQLPRRKSAPKGRSRSSSGKRKRGRSARAD